MLGAAGVFCAVDSAAVLEMLLSPTAKVGSGTTVACDDVGLQPVNKKAASIAIALATTKLARRDDRRVSAERRLLWALQTSEIVTDYSAKCAGNVIGIHCAIRLCCGLN